MKPTPSENELHASVAQFLDWALLPPAIYTTFPAGWGKLGRATAGWLRKCGLKEGMPDILIFHGGKTFGIELKVGKNKESAAQQDMFTKLMRAGVPVFVCRSIDNVWTVITELGLPVREMQVQLVHAGDSPLQLRRTNDGTQRQATRSADGAGSGIT